MSSLKRTPLPARCDAAGSLVNDGGFTRIDERGQLLRNGNEGIFAINADGSGTQQEGTPLLLHRMQSRGSRSMTPTLTNIEDYPA